jgi:cytoskeletal protein CcmA (bactofilin family)/microcystin-dependent protein
MNGNKKTKFKQGRLGIGTDDPKYPLDIIGDIRLTGCIRDASGNPLPLSHSSYKDLSNSNLIIWNKNSPTVPGVNIFKKVGINKNHNLQAALDISGGISIDAIKGNIADAGENKIQFKDITFITDLSGNDDIFIRDQQLRAANEGNGWFRENNTLKTKHTGDNNITLVKMQANEHFNLRLRENQTTNNNNLVTTIKGNLDCSQNTIKLTSADLLIKTDISLNKSMEVNDIDIDGATNLTGDIKTNQITVDGNLDVSKNTIIDAITTIDEILDISKGEVKIKNMDVSQNVNISGKLNIIDSGSIHHLDASKVNINDMISNTQMNIKGSMDFSGNATSYVRNTLLVKEHLTIYNDLNANNLNVSNKVDVSGNFTSDGLVNVNDNVVFHHYTTGTLGDISVNNLLDVSNVNIRDRMDVSNNVSIGIANETYKDVSDVDISGEITGDSFVGMISWFASTMDPPGWLRCDGGEYGKENYPQLYKIIEELDASENYLVGDLSFNVPDLMDASRCFIRGAGGSGNDVGKRHSYKTNLNNVTFDPSGEHTHFINNKSATPHKHFYESTTIEEGDISRNLKISEYDYKKLSYYILKWQTINYIYNYQIEWGTQLSSSYPTFTEAVSDTSEPDWFESKLINYYSVNDPPNNDIFDQTFSTSNIIDTTQPDFEWYKINSLDGDSQTLKHNLFYELSDKDITETTSVEQDTEHKHTHICESNGEHKHDTTNWDDETAPPSISMVPFIKY